MLQLYSLFEFIIKNDKEEAKKLASIIMEYESKNIKLANSTKTIPDKDIIIDLYELESLVNPNKFKFPKTNLEYIGVENIKHE